MQISHTCVFTVIHTSSCLQQTWDHENPCPHCGCIFLGSEKRTGFRKQCCKEGKLLSNISYPTLAPLPQELRRLAIDRIEHFSARSSFYNGILALGATGVDNGRGGGWESIHGEHAVKLNGRTYHHINTAHRNGGLHHFIWDETSLFEHSHGLNSGRQAFRVEDEFLHRIYREQQQCNRIIQDCEQIGTLCRTTAYGNMTELQASINVSTCIFDVAAITPCGNSGELTLTIQLKGETHTRTIKSTSEWLEPLSYPLLFPHGENGWDKKIKDEVSYDDYLRGRMLIPDRDEGGGVLTVRSKDNAHELPVNRFQVYL
jgi:hypothetical protein